MRWCVPASSPVSCKQRGLQREMHKLLGMEDGVEKGKSDGQMSKRVVIIDERNIFDFSVSCTELSVSWNIKINLICFMHSGDNVCMSLGYFVFLASFYCFMSLWIISLIRLIDANGFLMAAFACYAP